MAGDFGDFLAGGTAGAGLGGTLGSVVPGLGTGIGAGIGFVGGGLANLFGSGGDERRLISIPLHLRLFPLLTLISAGNWLTLAASDN
jgi:hypothetical protein